MDALDKKSHTDKRKKKDEKRREAKEARKGRIQEKNNQKVLSKAGGSDAIVGTKVVNVQKVKEKQILKKHEQTNREMLTDEAMAAMRFPEKLSLVKTLTNNIIAYPAFAYRKLRDLLKLCSDSNIDVVLKATKNLCDIFCDILPDYRIR